MKRSCFKSCFCSKAGFTLIELLVVVLIIGILAAVAVPQYRLAVRKTQFREIQTLGMALEKAQEIYYLENGKYATSAGELAFSIPSLKKGISISWPNNGKAVNLNMWVSWKFTTQDQIQYFFRLRRSWAWNEFASSCIPVGKLSTEVCKNVTGKTQANNGRYYF